MDLTGKTIVLYDGVCGLCNRLVRFLLRFDRRDRFRYAPLQSQFANELLKKHGLNSSDLDSVTLIADYGLSTERAYRKSEAIVLAAGELGGVWRIARIGGFLPHAFRDFLYNLIARNRYRMFGKYDYCPTPNPEQRSKFIE
jgi:predicted DCC family thiol-disulfide oxidoreductase YuxK